MTNPIVSIMGLVLSMITEAIVLYFLLPMLEEVGAVRKNFKGMDIPVSAGLSFPVTVLFVYLLYGFGSWYEQTYHLFILGIIFICFLGFIDDMLGARDTLGFRGHFGALFRGRLTTGGLKALGGGLIALFVAFFSSQGWGNILLNTLILALFTNMLNLLDLRPGRAVKGFLFFFVAIAGIAGLHINYLLVAPLLGAVLWYFPVDLRARAMMGDAGSNVLGFSLGYLVMTSLSFPGRMGVLVFLIGMHLYTEKYSLTNTIENNTILRKIDRIGRSEG
ncbi:MAG: hypothetical protein U9N81_02875 [Bacillota bacterium]|nr:hypothetical protein [Bacillota bacterium]